MPEKVTSLNGLKVTSEYWSYNTGAHNKDYVKSNNKRNKNQYVEAVACYFPTPATSHGSFRNRVLS